MRRGEHVVSEDEQGSRIDVLLAQVEPEREPGEGEFPGWALVEKGVDPDRTLDPGEAGPDET